MEIRSVLIDDEKSSIITLGKLLEKHCPEILVVGTAQNVQQGIEAIRLYKPDLVFLDVNMPDGDGFEVIEQCRDYDFEVIFITAFDNYALKAFSFAALHYLLKPIKTEELICAVERFSQNKETHQPEKIKVFSEHLSANPQKMILPSATGLSIVEIDDIIRCESSNTYTTFFLKNNEKIMVSKSINMYEHMLCDLHFVRIHSKHIINMKYIKKYVKGRGGYVVMINDMHVDVSEGKKKDFLHKLSEYSRG